MSNKREDKKFGLDFTDHKSALENVRKMIRDTEMKLSVLSSNSSSLPSKVQQPVNEFAPANMTVEMNEKNVRNFDRGLQVNWFSILELSKIDRTVF